MLACLLALVAWIRPTPVSPARPVVLMTGEWAPYVGADLPHGGPVTQMVSLALRQQGYEPDVRASSWQVATQTAQRGGAMRVFPLVGSRERAADFISSRPLASFQYVLFYDRTRLPQPPTSAADLHDLRVARIAGYDYWGALDDAVDGFVPFPTSRAAFEALARGEVDLVPEGLLPGQAVVAVDYILRRNADGQVLKAGHRQVTALVDFPVQEFAKVRAIRDAENRAATEAAELVRADLAAALGR